MVSLGLVFPPKSLFLPERDMPDLTGFVTMVTGGYAGIGYQTVKALLKKNAKVYIAGRSRTKAEEAIGKLRNEVNGRVDAHFLELDLGNLKSVKRAVGDYTNRESKLHILFNNGGVMHPPLESLTSDGYDDQFGINVLGHFYFTKLLLPILLATAAQPSPRPFSGPTCRVRVVNTSSIAHYNATGIDFSIVRGHSEKRNKVGIEALYGQSKLANVIFAQELHKRYGDMGIVSTSLHPGIVKSELQRNFGGFQKCFMKIMPYTAESHGPLTQLWAGTSPETETYGGKYFTAWARLGEPSPKAGDARLGEELWNWLEDQVKDI
ncbi:NAD-P-binding protein [Pterulicium gracile]|uniref:NAD-P-binding protein n=1 Tax=Pterulicium gracile TaxID=1884261 RepID=A0A5C3QDU2_9AGAR|nr:NAD-P-binding protein [Pterula gracilis]